MIYIGVDFSSGPDTSAVVLVRKTGDKLEIIHMATGTIIHLAVSKKPNQEGQCYDVLFADDGLLSIMGFDGLTILDKTEAGQLGATLLTWARTGKPERTVEELERQLERANRIIGWMMPYIGTMCPPDNGLYDLNQHYCENHVPEPGDETKGPSIRQHAAGARPTGVHNRNPYGVGDPAETDGT